MTTSNPETTPVLLFGGVLFISCLETICDAILTPLAFPYVRTIQVCNSTILPVDHDSQYWSGSIYCTDTDWVAREAQTTVSLSSSLSTIAGFLVVALYGMLADSWGRTNTATIHFIGHGFAALVWALFPINSMYIFGRVLSSASGLLSPLVNAMIIDIVPTDKRQSWIGVAFVSRLIVATGVRSAVTVWVLAKHVTNYRPFYLLVVALNLFGLTFMILFPETLKKEARRAARLQDANPFPVAQIVLNNPKLLRVYFVVLPLICGTSCFSVSPGWVIVVYKWRQEVVSYVLLLVVPVTVFGAALWHFVVQFAGTRFALFTAHGLLVLCTLISCIMESAPWLYVLTMFVVSIAVGVFPTAVTALSRQGNVEDQGKLQAGFMLLLLPFIAVMVIVYSILFEYAKDSIVSAPFYLGAAFALLSLVIACTVLPQPESLDRYAKLELERTTS